MDFLKKIQALPEEQRKIILWVGVGIIAIVVLGFWSNLAKKRLESLEDQELFKEVQSSEFDKEKLLPIEEIKQEWEKLQELREIMQKQELSPEDLERLKEMAVEGGLSAEELEELEKIIADQELN